MKQIIFSRIITRGGDFGNDQSGSPAFTSLHASQWTETAQGAGQEADATAPWSVAGTFTNLYIALDTPCGANSGFYTGFYDAAATFTLRQNLANSALTTTLATGTSIAPLGTASVTASPGDTFSIERTSTATNALLKFWDVHISLTFTSTNTGESGWSSSQALTPTTLDATSTYTIGPWCNTDSMTITTGDVYNYDVVMAPGSVTRLDAAVQTAPGGVASRQFALVKNGTLQDGSGGTVDTRVTITGASKTGNTTFTLPVVALDKLALRITPSGTPASSKVSWGTRFLATTDAQYNLCLCTNNTTPSNTTTDWASFAAADGWGQVSYTAQFGESCMAAIPGQDRWSVIGLYVRFSDASSGPGAGASYAFTPRLGGVSVGPTLSITGTNINGQTNAGTLITSGVSSKLAFQETPTGNPVSQHIAWTFLVSTISTQPGTGGGTPGTPCSGLS